MLPVALLVNAALAKEPEVELVAAKVRTLSAQSSSTVLIGATTAELERALIRMIAHDPALRAKVVSVPLTGDAETEMGLALSSNGLLCGLRVAGAADGSLKLQSFGTCDGKGVVRAPTVEPASRVADTATRAMSPTPADPPRTPAMPPSPATPSTPVVLLAPPVAAPAVDPWKVLLVDHQVPDPTTAVLLSTFVGFGSGHFYAKDDEVGNIHASVQGSALGLVVVGRVLMITADTVDAADFGSILSNVGTIAFGVDRIVDAWTAPLAAHEEARRQIQRQLGR